MEKEGKAKQKATLLSLRIVCGIAGVSAQDTENIGSIALLGDDEWAHILNMYDFK